MSIFHWALALAITLTASATHAVTITVHTTPSFTVEGTNQYAQAFVYANQADALVAANLFLDSGAEDNGWGVGFFGGENGAQTHWLFLAYATTVPTETRGVRLASGGNHNLGERGGNIFDTDATWTYDGHANNQFLLLTNAFGSVPEPGSSILLSTGLAFLLTRRGPPRTSRSSS